MDFVVELDTAKNKVLTELEEVSSLETLDALQRKYLGRKGVLRNFFTRLANLAGEEKVNAGKLINQLKNEISRKVEEKQQKLGLVRAPVSEEMLFDTTLPGESKELGRLHPLYQTITELNNIFLRLGFDIVYGPEIETEHYNFEALNIPVDHPSRDAFDTFYLAHTSERLLLRSHTSPVQVRVMEKTQPPLAVIVPGKVFRPDTPSPSRFPMFHQVEGLMVGEGVSFSHLKGMLDLFLREFFGKEIRMRFRPSFFPFTEPSAEVDISCVICGGSGSKEQRAKSKEDSKMPQENRALRSTLYASSPCTVCRGEGWLEILGAGMVHPKVFEAVGYDPELYTGFAFGMGVERMAMLKYRINDIRLFTENHIKFLSQF